MLDIEISNYLQCDELSADAKNTVRGPAGAHLWDMGRRDSASEEGAASSGPSQLPTLSRAGQHAAGAASPPKPGEAHPATGVTGGGGDAFSLPFSEAESTDSSRPRGVCFLLGEGHCRLSSSPLRSLQVTGKGGQRAASGWDGAASIGRDGMGAT